MSANSFLESCGKLFFSRMRPSFFLALIVFPILASALFLFLENHQLEDLESRFARAARKEKSSLEKKERKERFLNRYSQADPYFLDQKIESFLLLQKEKGELESLSRHPAFPESQTLTKRLRFLQENSLHFTEENMRTSSKMKEVEEKQRHPIQMDETDLKALLAMIEDIPIEEHLPSDSSPQLLIKDFRMKKIEIPLQREVFEVEIDLLKREFIK